MKAYDPKIAELITDPESLVPEEVRDKVSKVSLQNPVSNMRWDYLYFRNSSVFSPAANDFRKNKDSGNPCYTKAPIGTSQYISYWREQQKRCLEGYEVGGVRITGEHYFYLNFCPIEKKTEDKKGRILKKSDFPSFLLMDYYYFLELESRENPQMYGLDPKEKKGMVIAKARRKGFSFKNAAGAMWIYTFFEKSRVIIASENEDKATNTYLMARHMSSFLNEYTEFRHPRLRTTNKILKAGWIEKIDGQDVEKGHLSEIRIITLKDKPDNTAGLSCSRIIFEEAGLINHLKKAYRFAEPTLRDGAYWVGIPIVFGTGGDMLGSTQDFSDMFSDPESYGLASFENIYEESELMSHCGWFIDEMWYRPGESYVDESGKLYLSIDDNGNPNRWVAELALDEERLKAIKGSKEDFDIAVTQKCKFPSEAFLKPQGNVFPIPQLQVVANRLKSGNRYKIIGTPGKLELSKDPEKPVKFVPDLSLQPIYSYPFKQNKMRSEGAVVIYEAPPPDKIPYGMYKIGYDPVKFDIINGRSVFKSLASLIVYKSYQQFEHGHDRIVAEYTGRYEDTDKINETAMLLAMYYGNAEIMHENEIGKDVMSYFKRKNKLHLLARQPDAAIGKVIRNSRVMRHYGAPMNDMMKQHCEKWTLNWLWAPRGQNEDGELIYNMDLIPSLGLVEELLAYNRDANCDRVMALFQLMLVIEETKEEEIHAPSINHNIAQQLLERIQ